MRYSIVLTAIFAAAFTTALDGNHESALYPRAWDIASEIGNHDLGSLIARSPEPSGRGPSRNSPGRQGSPQPQPNAPNSPTGRSSASPPRSGAASGGVTSRRAPVPFGERMDSAFAGLRVQASPRGRLPTTPPPSRPPPREANAGVMLLGKGKIKTKEKNEDGFDAKRKYKVPSEGLRKSAKGDLSAKVKATSKLPGGRILAIGEGRHSVVGNIRTGGGNSHASLVESQGTNEIVRARLGPNQSSGPVTVTPGPGSERAYLEANLYGEGKTSMKAHQRAPQRRWLNDEQ